MEQGKQVESVHYRYILLALRLLPSSVTSAPASVMVRLRRNTWQQDKHCSWPQSPGINRTNILCVRSILAGSKAPKSLIHGNGIVATHSPTMAATSSFVQNGRRRIYDRIRAGLIWGIEVIGIVVASTPSVWGGCYAGALCCAKMNRLEDYNGTRVQGRWGASDDPPARVDLAPSQTDMWDAGQRARTQLVFCSLSLSLFSYMTGD